MYGVALLKGGAIAGLPYQGGYVGLCMFVMAVVGMVVGTAAGVRQKRLESSGRKEDQ